MKKKILFLIHDLGQGGAEKVLVNLVNHMDQSIFDISVISLFGGGVNEQFLKPNIHYHTVFKHSIPGNSRMMRILSPKALHRLSVKEYYDIEIAYLEGPSARIISGCPDNDTKLVSWIHTKFQSEQEIHFSFRSKSEVEKCYQRFDYTAFVSKDVGSNFLQMVHLNKPSGVLYNTIESDMILRMSAEETDLCIDKKTINIVTVGTLKEVKGYDRLLRIAKRLYDECYQFHLYILGSGPLEQDFKRFISDNQLEQSITLLGFDSNPYKYVSKCDLFVCSSYTEGFSTAVTEALIVGTPVCTVDISGMKEMLGKNNEYGIVTKNDEDALYEGIKLFLSKPELLAHYKEKAKERGKMFNTEKTVKAVEKMLLSL